MALAEPSFAAALALGRAQVQSRDTAPRDQDPPLLAVSTLGATALSLAGTRLDAPWLERRAGQLFKYLLAERGRTAKVDEIAENIWPGSDYHTGSRVRYYVHELRRELEPARASRSTSAYVRCAAGGYALDMARVEVDADLFQALIGEGLAHRERDPEAAAARIESAIALYGGEFLCDEPYASWAADERQRLHELACTGLSMLAEIRLAADRAAAAAEALTRLASLQPYDEDVHRRLIALDLRLGRRSDALRRYAALRSRLRREFGEEPGFTPAELCHAAARAEDANQLTGM
jgi:DNA-binding SARP family transcriptional activator